MSLEGQQISHYRLMRLLGSGGMGEVYLAEDAPIQRRVAIKTIQAEVTPYPNASTFQETTRLFQREARAIAMLDHPHILPLYDYGQTTINEATVSYLVMPYRPEGSLALWLRQQSSSALVQGIPLHAQDIVHLVSQAAGALQHAHDHQIIHQDIKPANFLIRGNQENPNRPDLLLADFGIARFTTASASTSRSIRGTPTYMAPEQLEGLAVPATDQYALAIMTYEILTGYSPFQGGIGQVMYQHLQVQPSPPSTHNPSLPADVDLVILQALAKKPEERFHSVSAFYHAFKQAMEGSNATTIMGERIEPIPDLRVVLAISDIEAVRGTLRNLTLPDGRQVSIAVPAGAYDGQLIHLDGQDIPSSSGRAGAFLITLVITPSVNRPTAANYEPTVAALAPSSYNQLNVPSQRHSRGLMVFLNVLVLLVVVGSLGYAFFYVTASKQQTSINTSGTALTHVSATTLVNPYTHVGTLALNDPLKDNNQNVDWMTGTNQNNATCEFVGGAYQSSQPLDGDFHACLALATDFGNFVFEVQMTIVSGYSGGIIFRANHTNSTFYYYRVGQDGSYNLRAYVDSLIDHSHLLVSGSSPSIYSGYNQANLIAVVANGSSLGLYANHQLIANVNSNEFSDGQIGVVAYNQGGLATVVYSNARVWTL